MAKIILLLALVGIAAAANIVDKECPENEYLAHATPMCPVTCQNRHRVHCLGLVLKESCQCIAAHTRDEVSHKCIPTVQCPQNFEQEKDAVDSDGGLGLDITPEEKEKIRASCDPATERFSETTPACPARCFAGRIDTFRCLAILMKPSCQCQEHLVRDAISNRCIHASECQHHLY